MTPTAADDRRHESCGPGYNSLGGHGLMLAMCFPAPGQPLRTTHRPFPGPVLYQLLHLGRPCGVCRTDLHFVDGELPHPKPAVVPGHEVVGVVVKMGERVERFAAGDRVGVPWLGHTCGVCRYCRS